MIYTLKEKFGTVLVKNFNLCLFVSFCLLAVYQSIATSLDINIHSAWAKYIYVPTFNGSFTSLIVFILNRIFNRRQFTKTYYSEEKIKLSLVAFFAGFFSYYISFSSLAFYAITILVIMFFVSEFKVFTSRLTILLTPNRLATPNDLRSFATFFINLIITFTIINLSVNHIHHDFGTEKAFNFQSGILGIIDALYFNIITMATVGFGDITPQNAIGKILISIECIISYLMFGILIGIITRGIKFKK